MLQREQKTLQSEQKTLQSEQKMFQCFDILKFSPFFENTSSMLDHANNSK